MFIEIHREVLCKWQVEWDNEKNGRWTWRMIKDINAWTSRKHGVVNFHLTQFLSNHGCFGDYVHRIGKLDARSCVDCQEAIDDAEHVFFNCDR